MRKIGLLAIVALLASAMLVPTTAKAAAQCAKANDPGGDWAQFGHDPEGTRWQDAKATPTADELLTRMPKWTFSVADGAGDGNFQSSPTIAYGCLFAGTNTGWIFGLNADTGELVWKTNLKSDDPYGVGLSGGVFSLLAARGKIYANVTALGSPYVAALDAKTGKILWKTIVSKEATAYTNSSPVIINGMIFMGISGPEDGPDEGRHPGGYAFVDADTGKLILRRWLASPKEDRRGQKGVSIWSTPVYDAETGYAYMGTGQPANKASEHPLSNSVIKLDMKPGRSTFGEVVDTYKGDYDDGADVDFGGSPTLTEDKDGNKIIGILQKSGKFHAIYADTMTQAWWARLASPDALGNAGSPASDGKSIFVAGDTNPQGGSPGYLYSFDITTGAQNWATPIGGGVDYHLIAGAGDVVYMITTHGALIGLNKADGTPVFVRSVAADSQDACANLSSGPAVARNTIYAVCDIGGAGTGWIIAY
ncbi:MAG: hypothetical protein QOG04_426 [Actinomycetota bacterium]|jgi:polyvinyl alcohol dehydrogenase (cytochrome)|nr:hypothetical protein [Actinomycetota bacterium]